MGITVAASSITVTLTRPIHNALLPEISRTTGDLTAGNAASGLLEALATFVGPLVSGLLLAVWPEFRSWWARLGLIICIVAGQGHGGFSGTRFLVGTRLGACRSTERVLRAWVVGMSLRETRRTSRDGSVVSFL